MGGRYLTDNPDLISRIKALADRISRFERLPRATHTAIDSGDLIVKSGRIEVTDSEGDPRIQLTSEAAPGFAEGTLPRLYLLTEDLTYQGMVVGYDQSYDGIDQTLSLFTLIDASTGVSISYVALIQTATELGHDGSFFQIHNFNALYGVDGNLYLVGKWLNEDPQGSTDAAYTGTRDVSAGVSSVTVSYPVTFASTIVPIVGLLNSAGALAWCLTAQSTSSFTVAWTGTLAKTLNMWCIRL